MRSKSYLLLIAAFVFALHGCGGGEEQRKNELVELREKVRQGTQDEERLFQLRGEVAQLRGRVNNLLSDPLRQDPTSLAERLRDTGERMGIKMGALEPTEIVQGEGPLRWQLYRTTIRGRNEYLKRWLQDLINWPVGIYPVRIIATDDPRTATTYRGTLDIAVPAFTPPPQAEEPPEPEPPGPEPQEDDEMAHELWRVRQNLARVEAAQAALPGYQQEKEALQAILTALEGISDAGSTFVSAFDSVLDAGERAGSLQAYVVDPVRVEVTAIVPTERAGQDLAQSLSRTRILRDGRVVSEEQTRVGLRVAVEAERIGDALVPLGG